MNKFYSIKKNKQKNTDDNKHVVRSFFGCVSSPTPSQAELLHRILECFWSRFKNCFLFSQKKKQKNDIRSDVLREWNRVHYWNCRFSFPFSFFFIFSISEFSRSSFSNLLLTGFVALLWSWTSSSFFACCRNACIIAVDVVAIVDWMWLWKVASELKLLERVEGKCTFVGNGKEPVGGGTQRFIHHMGTWCIYCILSWEVIRRPEQSMKLPRSNQGGVVLIPFFSYQFQVMRIGEKSTLLHVHGTSRTVLIQKGIIWFSSS